MRPETALYQLKNMPEAFLGSNYLIIAGAAQSGTMPFALTSETQFMSSQQQATINEKFRFSPSQNGGTLVHNVRMIPNGEAVDIQNIEPYVLDDSISPDIMVTGQLTGCVFVVKVMGDGRVIVAHIQPGGQRAGGAELRNQVMQDGAFRNYGEITHVFGLGDYDNSATVVGIRDSQGQWSIYGQTYDRLTQTLTGVELITTTNPWKPWFRSNPRGVKYVS
jgi:hypothetical protein